MCKKYRLRIASAIGADSCAALVSDVLSSFSASSQRGFPVVRKNILVGVVTQTDLAKLIEGESLDRRSLSEILTPHPVSVSPYDSLEDILFLFSRHKFTWLPVTYHDKLMGIILQSDVLQALFTAEHMPGSSYALPGEDIKASKKQ